MSDRERAKIKISLVSKGARSSLEGFVTPEQWGQIVATVNGQPAQATPVGPVAWANSKEFHDALARGQSFNGWRKKYSDCDMALFTTPLASVEPVARLTDAEIEQGRQEIFSVNNPYCPCDIKTMQKAVRWAERTIAARDTTPPASVEPDKKDAEWQPIETAPKGGAWALVYADGAINCAYVEAGKLPEDWTRPASPNVFSEDVTHWMPLPAPPDAAIAAQEPNK